MYYWVTEIVAQWQALSGLIPFTPPSAICVLLFSKSPSLHETTSELATYMLKMASFDEDCHSSPPNVQMFHQNKFSPLTHPELSTAQDDCDWLKKYKQDGIF